MAKIENPLENIEPVLPEEPVYVTVCNTDLTEGRGRNRDFEFFDDLDEAVAAAKGIDVQGTDGSVYEIVQLLPERRVKVWGTNFIAELGLRYTGFTPASGRFDDESLRERIRQTTEYQNYLRLKRRYEPYGL